MKISNAFLFLDVFDRINQPAVHRLSCDHVLTRGIQFVNTAS